MIKKGITEYPTHHLQESEIEEIRNLRGEDPDAWTPRKLANKFGCSTSFVRIVAPADKERKELHYKKLEVVKGTWGAIRRRAREDRTKRNVMAKSDAYAWPLE